MDRVEPRPVDMAALVDDAHPTREHPHATRPGSEPAAAEAPHAIIAMSVSAPFTVNMPPASIRAWRSGLPSVYQRTRSR